MLVHILTVFVLNPPPPRGEFSHLHVLPVIFKQSLFASRLAHPSEHFLKLTKQFAAEDNSPVEVGRLQVGHCSRADWDMAAKKSGTMRKEGKHT